MKHSLTKRKLLSLLLALCTMIGLFAVLQTPVAALEAEFVNSAKKMGQITVYHTGTYVGSDSYGLLVDLGGYMPQTITTTMTGNFTEAEARAAYDAYWADHLNLNLRHIAGGLRYMGQMRLFDTAIGDLHELNDTVILNTYYNNAYISNETPTSVTYTILRPGDLTVKSIVFNGPWYFSLYVYNEKTGTYEPRATNYSTYIDGQLVLECSVANNRFTSFKWHTANFQTKQKSGGQTVTPTTSRVYVDGGQVLLGAYNLGGNNYVKLRDVAALLNGTPAQFDVRWREGENLIELRRGTAYNPQGGELSSLAAGPVTASLSTSKIMYEHEWSAYFNPTERPVSWPSYLPYTPRYPYYTGLRAEGKEYIATVPEYFLPTAYNIGGNNFYKLRDIAHIAGFRVKWDAAANSVHILSEASD